MVETTNAHRGFDYATTVDGEQVPTASIRSLARRLKKLSCVNTVGWGGMYGEIIVHTDSMDWVHGVVTEYEDGVVPDFDISVDEVRDDGSSRMIIQPE